MNARRIEITVSQGTWERLEEARGLAGRATFVKWALESALNVGDVRGDTTPSPHVDPERGLPSRSASSRAPDVMREPLAPSGELKPRPAPRPACPECGAAGPLHQRGCSRMGKS